MERRKLFVLSRLHISDPLKSTNTYTLDNSAPVQPANLAIPGRVNFQLVYGQVS